MLGAALAGQGKFAEADPLIATGFAGLTQRQEKIAPKFRKLWFTMILESLVHVYESAKQPDPAAKWRAELEARKASKAN